MKKTNYCIPFNKPRMAGKDLYQTEPVPFFSAAAASFGVDVSASVRRVLERGQFVLGPQVQAFEQAFADYIGSAHAVGVGNGTDALIRKIYP